MSDKQHTPGPWEVHEATHCSGEFWCSIGANGRGPITDIVGKEGNHTDFFQPVAGMKYLITPVAEQRANARLIAAAPELLEALKLALEVLEIENQDGYDQQAIERAKAAITKAEGRQP